MPRTAALLAVLLLASAPALAGRTVWVGSDGDPAGLLEAVPRAVHYDEEDHLRADPLLVVPDLSPYHIEFASHVRGGRLVFRAEGPIEDGIPAVKESAPELRLKACLPSLTERVTLATAEGLDLVTAALRRLPDGEEVPVGKGFSLEAPPGGEYEIVLRVREGAGRGTVRLYFEVRGYDLSVVERFLAAYRPEDIVLAGTLPPPVVERLGAGRRPFLEQPPVLAGEGPVVLSASCVAGLVGAHVAGLDGLVHIVHRGDAEQTGARLRATGARRVLLIAESDGDGGAALAAALAARPECAGVTIERTTPAAAEAAACKTHYLGNAVVANPADLEFPAWRTYPRSSLLAPVYALLRRTGIVFVSGGDLSRYEEARHLRNVNYGQEGWQYGFAWEDVEWTRREIAEGVTRLDLGERPHLALLGGGHSIPCTFFIAGAWPVAEFPKVRFADDAVIYADSSVYGNLNADAAIEGAVGRLTGNTDEISAAIARAVFREEMEDREKVRARRALLVFGPWAAERDAPGAETFAEETARRLRAAGDFDCRAFTGSAWGRDFLVHIAGARVFFANDFGYHNAGFGWSSYAHKGFSGPEQNYNTQIFPLDFDASFCVVSSNGCATADDKNRDLLHYGGNSLPAALLFFRNGALGYYGMPNAALAEITTPLEALATGVTLGEAMRKHINDRLADPKGGGLFGGRDGWIAEVPGYDDLPRTHPHLWPLTKQDALVLLGDPLTRLDPPPEGGYLDLARGAGDFLVAGAKEAGAGLDLTGEEGPESAYGQSGAGAAIFLARLSEATGEKRYLEAALRAAAHVEAMTAKDDDRVPGLFTGDSGKGLLYLELARITKDRGWVGKAEGLARHFAGDWTYAKNGQPYWMTDLYAGAAGHLLFLLALHEVKKDAFSLAEARRAGDFLLRWAEPVGEGGRWWAMEPWGSGPKRYYTGVAHGAAGIAMALAALGRETKEAKYLTVAEQAAKGVMDLAMPLGKGYRWWARYSPEGVQEKYQWCHGPPGMLRMFLDLFAATGKPVYREWALRAAVTAAKPGKHYRDDMSLCHGPPGNGDIFLEAYEALGDERFLRLAEDHAECVRRHGLSTKAGLDFWGADRSYMNGVAGVGHFLLRLSAPGRWRPALIAR